MWLGDGPTNLETLGSAYHFDIEEGDVYRTGKIPFADLRVTYFHPNGSLM